MTLRQWNGNSSHRDDSDRDRDLTPPTSESNPSDTSRSIHFMRERACTVFIFFYEDSEGRTDNNLSPIT
jgi:hypothetical protein